MRNAASILLSHHYRGIEYPIRLLQRRNNKRLRLIISPTGDIRLSAPTYAKPHDILAFLQKHHDWINSQLANLPAANTQTIDYQHGSQHLLLGESLTLHLQPKKRHLHLDWQTRTLHAPEATPNRIATLLRHFYREQAADYLPKRLHTLLPKTPWVQTAPPIRLRRMKARWGSCNQQGRLTFNTHLIKAAPPLIDAVILHELCHLQEFNHSPRFYALMDTVAPNWRAHNSALNELTAILTRD